MRVDDVGELDVAVVGLVLQDWKHPIPSSSETFPKQSMGTVECFLLWWIRWVDDDGLFGLGVGYEVGVVVTTPLPYDIDLALNIIIRQVRYVRGGGG